MLLSIFVHFLQVAGVPIANPTTTDTLDGETLLRSLTMMFTDYAGFLWLILALLCLFAEVGTPGLFFFVSFAIGFAGASAAAFLGYSLVVQGITAAALALFFFLSFRFYFRRKNISDTRYEAKETNIDALIGQHGVVVDVIKPNHKGRVKIGGEEWSAQGQDGVALQPGTSVKVIRVVGNTVLVKAIA